MLEDEGGFEPWQEISELDAVAGRVLWHSSAHIFGTPSLPSVGSFDLKAAPRSDDDVEPSIIPSAVLGLFPINNQALIRS